MGSKRIGTTFTPLRDGIKAHFSRFAKHPEAYLVWSYGLTNAPRKGPDAGRVTINKRSIAAEWGWSYDRVVRAVRWLEMNPKRSKSYLVRVTSPELRGRAVEYYIRNYEGGDPSLDEETKPHSPTSEVSGKVHLPTSELQDPNLTRPRVNCPNSSSLASSLAHECTSEKVHSRHHLPTSEVQTYMTRALRRRDSEDEERESAMENGEKDDGVYGTDWAAEKNKCKRRFKTEKEMRDYFKFSLFANLPKEMIEQAVDTAMESPQTYGCGYEAVDETEAPVNVVELKVALDDAETEHDKPQPPPHPLVVHPNLIDGVRMITGQECVLSQKIPVDDLPPVEAYDEKAEDDPCPF